MSARSSQIPLIETITSTVPEVRDRSVRDLIAGATVNDVLEACADLERFRRGAENLYERVRASMFLHAIYRYALQEAKELPSTGLVPFEGVEALMERRFEQGIAVLRAELDRSGPNGAICSALAQAYEQITYQTLADQVRRSVRSSRGSRWMFRVGQANEHPVRLHPRRLGIGQDQGAFPILAEFTPVRLDLSHSAWSDIFFLGMDYPEGARVLNISVDLGVYGRDEAPSPPIETYCRVIAEPILRLTSIDLEATKDVATLGELFNFGNDYLGLVKAGVIASGLIPPSMEGTGTPLAALLARVVRPGFGLEVVSKVNDIPKGSRLAVSTNLLASIISLLMRATGQARNLTGPLGLEEARVVVSRAILGEWLGGSGGGWQDSGGIFQGVKQIQGVAATPEDPEWGVSRGRLLPMHELMENRGLMTDAGSTGSGSPQPFDEALASSLVLVHGGMAQNVGPILNMVTEKYLLRSGEEWAARQEALRIFEGIIGAVRASDVHAIGRLTTANWDGPLKRIIPWVSNRFTEEIIREAKEALGEDFWGFLMLGGMSGGGMGFFVAPHRHAAFRDEVGAIMKRVKATLDDALPFAMEPVVYDFRINPQGTTAHLKRGAEALMPTRYYSLQVKAMIADGTGSVDPARKADIDHFANSCADTGELLHVFRTMINTLFPVPRAAAETATDWDQASER
ncbi:MAG: UTP--glucose-1-phosphate uridylyltransferase, partial [Isosphaeraceae bacterium]